MTPGATKITELEDSASEQVVDQSTAFLARRRTVRSEPFVSARNLFLDPTTRATAARRELALPRTATMDRAGIDRPVPHGAVKALPKADGVLRHVSADRQSPEGASNSESMILKDLRALLEKVDQRAKEKLDREVVLREAAHKKERDQLAMANRAADDKRRMEREQMKARWAKERATLMAECDRLSRVVEIQSDHLARIDAIEEERRSRLDHLHNKKDALLRWLADRVNEEAEAVQAKYEQKLKEGKRDFPAGFGPR
jgi:hypothetical protein